MKSVSQPAQGLDIAQKHQPPILDIKAMLKVMRGSTDEPLITPKQLPPPKKSPKTIPKTRPVTLCNYAMITVLLIKSGGFKASHKRGWRTNKSSLHTSRQDEKTIHAMLDMAQSKNWTAIKLKGTEEFKQKAWFEASLRGIEVKGYTPTEKDLAELQVKQQACTTNQVEMTTQRTPEPKKDIEQPKVETQEQEVIKDSWLIR